MEAEQEKWLIQQLKEGIEIKDLFPHGFFNGFVYYDITIHGKRISLVVEVKRGDLQQHKNKPLIMEITKVFQIVGGEKEKVQNTKLVSQHVVLISVKSNLKETNENTFLLNGKIFLQ